MAHSSRMSRSCKGLIVLWLGACSATPGANDSPPGADPGGIPKKNVPARGSGGTSGASDGLGGATGVGLTEGGGNARDSRSPGPQVSGDGGVPIAAAPPPVAMGDRER